VGREKPRHRRELEGGGDTILFLGGGEGF